MKYLKSKNFIEIFGEEEFDIKQILECGQIFSFKKLDSGDYEVLSTDKRAVVKKKLDEAGYIIETNDTAYFEEFFDIRVNSPQKSFDYLINFLPYQVPLIAVLPVLPARRQSRRR